MDQLAVAWPGIRAREGEPTVALRASVRDADAFLNSVSAVPMLWVDCVFPDPTTHDLGLGLDFSNLSTAGSESAL
jgi:hypothetical protein